MASSKDRERDIYTDAVNHKILVDRGRREVEYTYRIISVEPFEAFETITEYKRLVRGTIKTIPRIQFKLSKALTESMLTFTEKLVLSVSLSQKQICLLERREEKRPLCETKIV